MEVKKSEELMDVQKSEDDVEIDRPEIGFGDRLRKLRRGRKVKQIELAEYLKLKPAAVAKYEANKDAYPNSKTLVKIADYFKVSIDYLILGRQTVPVNDSENMVNNSFIQENIPADNNGIVMNGQLLTPELTELIRIYGTLDGRERIELLGTAVKLQEKAGKNF